jgi:hypothetical protein
MTHYKNTTFLSVPITRCCTLTATAWANGCPRKHLQDQARSLSRFTAACQKKLAGFSEEARKYLQQRVGRAVYAGGGRLFGVREPCQSVRGVETLAQTIFETGHKPLF